MRQPPKTILLIEDNLADVRLLREMLSDEGAPSTELTHVASMREAEALLRSSSFALVLLDLGLGDARGLAAVRRAHAAAPAAPLIVLTGMDDDELAALALHEGAQDFLIKGQIDARGLRRAIQYAIARKNTEDALFAEKERAQVTLDCIADAVICTDVMGKITFLNLVAENLTGWSRREAMGRPMERVFHVVGSNSQLPIADPARLAIDCDRIVHIPLDSMLIRRDGREIPIEDSVAPIHDRQGNATGSVIVFRDVSLARAMSRRIAHSAEHDFLTGLPNRMLFNDRVTQAVSAAPRHNKKVAVLFLDLDGFKYINDSLGHPIGDKLLQSVAKRLVDCVRSSDTVCRQGGDEFVVLLAELEHAEDAAITARRMLEAISETHTIEQRDIHVTTSMGVSVYPDDGADAETLIKNADTAMYQSKENGRQSFTFFRPAMNVRAVERQSIEECLRRALDRQELALHYQPLVNLATGQIRGVEALIRWTHPVRGSIPPTQFIPVAEDCGLILSIGDWALREACTQARTWLDAGLPATTMAVNVSARQFQSEHFLSGILAILEDTGLDPSSLELEITESVLMKRADATAAILRSLRSKGVGVSIDDFGTGYSSLSHLCKFPADALKIDRSIVNQIGGAGEDAAVVTAVISMAHNLNLRVVAEGVETIDELHFLQARQCDAGQGYYFSPPVPPSAFAKLLAAGMPGGLHIPSLATSAMDLREAARG